MNIEDYVKEKHPNVFEEHNRFIRSFVPSIGSELVSLVDSFGGLSGQPLEVIGYSALGCGMDVFIELKNVATGERCMCPVKKWHNKVKLIKGDYIGISCLKFNDE
ncbi:hypothetical protein [Gottfriedia acidiceleris]|uniref:hypothetical protein n=1 Tax=Gottfriedia acidiceleris TaxID=371036 RepID=UPI00101D82B8|nr:hypothetical protein [Gottfriedia acidiceleris]